MSMQRVRPTHPMLNAARAEARGLGHLIYERRLALDLSLLQVSRRCNISLAALCDLERGHGQPPTPFVLEHLGEVLALPWLHQATWEA